MNRGKQVAVSFKKVSKELIENMPKEIKESNDPLTKLNIALKFYTTTIKTLLEIMAIMGDDIDFENIKKEMTSLIENLDIQEIWDDNNENKSSLS